MSLTDNERVQDAFLVAGDRLVSVSRRWWIALGLTIVLALPAYFLIKAGLTSVFVGGYKGPQIIYTSAIKEPLQVLDKKIFMLPDGAYAGFIKLRNTNLEWGVADQKYTAEFKTLGGTVVTKVEGTVFVLPASEKLIVFARFTADAAPSEILFTLHDTHFIHKPEISASLETQRTTVENSGNSLVVNSAVKNLSAFTLRQVHLPVAVYDTRNQVVGVNYTNINEVRSGETRSFQYVWPYPVPGAVRAEIIPELNIFDRSVLGTEEGTSPF